MKKAERLVLERVRERAGGLCEICHKWLDFRGLSHHHDPPKRMGGTKHIYTESEITMRCGKCHSSAHGIREV